VKPFVDVAGRSLAALVYRACAPGPVDERFDALVDRLEEARVDSARVLKWGRPYGVLSSARAAARARRAARQLDRRSGVRAGDLAVVTGGSIAHIYVGRKREGTTLEEIERRYPRLLPAVLAAGGVGVTVARRTARGPLVLWRGEAVPLDHEIGLRALRPFRSVGVGELSGILRQIVGTESAGDLVVFGAFARAGAVTFEPERGSHGGVHPDELDLFVIPPDGMTLPVGRALHPADLGTILRRRYASGE
jgi:hypothetical protein